MLDQLQIKVCGITDINQALALDALCVDYIGFIFYAPSKRYVLNNVALTDLKIFTPTHAKKVGVFVNESIESIVNTVVAAGLDMVQLHGDESPSYCEHISHHVNTIKAFRIGNNENLPYKTFPFNEVVDFYLFDTLGKQYGGTGEQFKWDLLCHAPVPKPYFLSGGIGPEDVDQLSQFCENEKKLFAIDVNSKFEQSPGVKDMNKVKDFFNAIKMIN